MTEEDPSRLFPSLWATCPISHAGETSLGQTKTRLNTEGDIGPYLRVANVQDDVLDLAELAEMPFASPEQYLLAAGDTLLCESQSRELVGRAAPYTGEPSPLYYQNHLIRFRAAPGIDNAYALLVFRAYQKNGVFSAIAKGATGLAHLGLSRFRALPFPLPPSAVQREIALRGRGVQDGLDLLKDAMETCVEQLEPLIRDARDIEILGQHRDGWQEAPGSLPWPMLGAGDIVPEDAPIVYGILQPGPDLAGGVPYIRGMDLQEGTILEDQLHRTSRAIAARYERSSLKEGDVLLGIIRHMRVAIVPRSLEGANITQGTARIRPGPGIDPAYLAHWLSSGAAQEWLRSRMRGIDMPGLNLRDVRELPVPVPSYSEQLQIAARLDAVVDRARYLRSSFLGLLAELPSLESDLTASLAYGEQASSIAHEISGPVQAALSQELAQQLAEAEARRAAAPKRKVGRSVKSTATATHDRSVTSGKAILEVLRTAGGRSSPEMLFRDLRLDAVAVDTFYAALRVLRRSGDIVILRPSSSAVVIALAEDE